MLRLTFDGPPAPERVPDGITIRSYSPADADAGHRGQRPRVRPPPRAGRDGRGRTSIGVRRRTGSIPPGCSSPSGTGGSSGSTGPRSRTAIGEVYVVGIDPDAQGGGLGTALTARGLRHLYERGLPIVDLYVEGDNAPALKVYRNLGFQDWKKDVLYSPADGLGTPLASRDTSPVGARKVIARSGERRQVAPRAATPRRSGRPRWRAAAARRTALGPSGRRRPCWRTSGSGRPRRRTRPAHRPRAACRRTPCPRRAAGRSPAVTT